jgi:hypothetical protein
MGMKLDQVVQELIQGTIAARATNLDLGIRGHPDAARGAVPLAARGPRRRVTRLTLRTLEALQKAV